MTNAWNVTEAEYQTAKEREHDPHYAPEDRAAYWQLIRFYRNQLFLRDQAARALKLIRARP